ncbi:general substrate transporter [Trichoderma barbatum]
MAVSPERDAALDDFIDIDPAVAIATDDEDSLSIKEAFRRYPTSVLWAIAMSLTIVMEGYDTILISSLFAYPSFVDKYGVYDSDLGQKSITGAWHAGLVNASSCGAIIGLIINGFVTEKFGHRIVTTAALAVMSAFIFITFFAPSIQVLTAGQALVGIPWGIFAIMGSTYSSEFVAAGVLQDLVNNNAVWSFRIPFAIQWAWPVPLFILTLPAPDSPWWLVRKGRLADAEKSIRKPSSGLTDTQVKQKLAMMVHTDKFEKAVQAESSYRDCFKGTNLRRTEIACVILAAQTLPGQAMCYSASYFFTQAGLPSADAYKLNLGSIALAFIATCLSWVLMTFFGRRTLLIAGLGLLTLDLLVIGCLSYAAGSAGQWAQSALAMLWLGIYSATVGPQSFALAAEISATRLRSQTISLARNAYNDVNIVDNTVESYLINPTEANLKGKTAFFWFGLGVLTAMWAVFRLTETKNRTYEELDVLFERHVPAWKFSSAQIDVVAETEIIQAGEKGNKAQQIEFTEVA